ncbi:hypothetical protein Hdeb2414_s0008g00290981 [Helianthus debilis subsp. tardiflorus]
MAFSPLGKRGPPKTERRQRLEQDGEDGNGRGRDGVPASPVLDGGVDEPHTL